MDQGYGLSKDDLIWFRAQYLNSDEEQDNPLASPLRSPNFSGLPPALIITAEYDILRDEGELYAQRLQEAHVPVILTRYEGMIHGFIRMSLKRSKQALAECATALRVAFALQHPR
jgi:acetyl esterase